jgi:D-beta-D-heptose 7-phosphate kinase/D-beta-D-heptose 1-phosphate adenosyltransferase
MNLDIKENLIVVVGDIMVDEYVYGEVARISPEAPIPVLDYQERLRLPGGAANVAMNLARLGAKVMMLGSVGDDDQGHWIRKYLNDAGIDVSGLVINSFRPTTHKLRYGTRRQIILRVDTESKAIFNEHIYMEMIKVLNIKLSQIDALVVSDYSKGCFSGSENDNSLLSWIYKNSGKIQFTCADTKKTFDELSVFNGFTFLKPNKLELEKSVGITVTSRDDLTVACGRYLQKSKANAVLVTLGSSGIAYYSNDELIETPTIASQVYDVTGAGDTVIAVAILLLTSGYTWDTISKYANIAASYAVESRGTTAISLAELEDQIDRVKKIFPDYL